MNYVDRHVHTRFSPDSNASVEGYIERAKELDLDYLLFTDHMDFGTKDPAFQVSLDYVAYSKYMKDLEESYGIPIKIGVEVGYEKDHKEEIKAFLASYDFDFVIASIHYGGGKDFYLGDFFEGKTKEEAYQEYFEIILEMVENFEEYDVVGHLDFISRYGPYEDKHYNMSDYQEVIDKILMTIIEKGKGIEVNTSGLRQGLGVSFPKDEVIKRYRELGGTKIAVGSDSHSHRDFMAGVEETVEKLKAMGFELI